MRYFVIFAALALAVAGLLTRIADRAVRTPAPQTAAVAVVEPARTTPSAGSRSITIPRDARGHFQVDARVDGRRLGFMVDTGASTIALTASNAKRLGIHPSPGDFSVNVRTANGTVRAAPATLNMVEVGGLVVRDVRALVVPDNALSENLLGMSFLAKLRRFEYANGKLVLEQ
ncbi:MAG: TIGR02281 family clan AA aspartic protease [Pseudorhodoplanes sp.]|nr:TIGR02281 family clan AA aspartic protease [Pseudorhodoplanes sp.]MCQ3942519.1 TIGR02281 family clan AA aspartic protease [Alphaproteobacteria bacterium]MCZ7642461.1 TIGR02281 family clan AA aspartic protease [Pseudorhodoplanes sp.]GIK81136.1 MAG: peptidase [Alphaproteobacteria bacterium]